jgi:DNA-binding XRE family transcriptional regulator
MEIMATMKRPRLAAVKALSAYRLRLTFVDGSIYTVSLADEFDKFPGLAPLRDSKAFSKAVVIEGEGWTVEWPALDIQIGADTLWLDAQAQNAPDENTRLFAQWRARHGLSLADAAKALGMTSRTMSAYGSGNRPVPRYIALACKGWEAERELKR